jgi:hypothetical protein
MKHLEGEVLVATLAVIVLEKPVSITETGPK